MTISLKFYADAGLTAPLSTLSLIQASDGSGAAADCVAYLGSTAAGKIFKASSNPGVTPIQVSLADSAPAAGVNASHVKLATSLAGLTGATAGAAISLGTQILSGAAHSVAVHVRVDTPALAVGNYADITLSTNTLNEGAA